MAGAITALMCGEAYAQSSRIAERMGRSGLRSEREPMLDVIRMHREAMRGSSRSMCRPNCSWPPGIVGYRAGARRKYGYKNSQVTVLAPTGTIGFMMDCDTTASSRTWRW